MVKKVGLIIVLSIVALCLILVGVGFFITSLYFYLVTVFHNPTIAALFAGVVFLLVAILLLLIAILIKSSLFRFKARKKLQAKIKAVADDPATEALQVVREHPYYSALAAVASGFLLGFSPKIRDSVIDGVSTYLQTGSIAEGLKSMKSEEDKS